MSNWNEQQRVIAGDYGEALIDRQLFKMGFITYQPVQDSVPHLLDRIAIDRENLDLLVYDVKSKPRLNKYPKTGFEASHYKEYKALSDKHKLPFFIFFVDHLEGKIYGNYIHELDKHKEIAPWGGGKQVLFPLSCMTMLGELTEDDIKYLQNHTESNYK